MSFSLGWDSVAMVRLMTQLGVHVFHQKVTVNAGVRCTCEDLGSDRPVCQQILCFKELSWFLMQAAASL